MILINAHRGIGEGWTIGVTVSVGVAGGGGGGGGAPGSDMVVKAPISLQRLTAEEPSYAITLQK